MSASQPKYTPLSRWLHWVSSLLIFGMLGAGLFMVSLPDGEPQKLIMYRTHGTLGLLLVLATVARAIIRWRSPQPLPAGLASWNQVLYKATHWAIYLVLIALGLAGMGALALNGVTSFGVDPAALNRDFAPFQGHFLFSRLLIVLVLLHLAGVLLYQFTKGDVTSRMGLKLPSKQHEFGIKRLL
jgi:cytochrome b561